MEVNQIIAVLLLPETRSPKPETQKGLDPEPGTRNAERESRKQVNWVEVKQIIAASLPESSSPEPEIRKKRNPGTETFWQVNSVEVKQIIAVPLLPET